MRVLWLGVILAGVFWCVPAGEARCSCAIGFCNSSATCGQGCVCVIPPGKLTGSCWGVD